MQIGAGLRRAGLSRRARASGRAARCVVRGAAPYAAIAHSRMFRISLAHDRVAVLRSRRRTGRQRRAAACGARCARWPRRGSRPARSLIIDARLRGGGTRDRCGARSRQSRRSRRRDRAHAHRAARRSSLRLRSACGRLARAGRARARRSTRAARCRLAIVTGLERATVDSLLSLAELDGAFEVIIAAEDVACGEASPDGYRKALERMHGAARSMFARHSRSRRAPPAHEPRAPPGCAARSSRHSARRAFGCGRDARARSPARRSDARRHAPDRGRRMTAGQIISGEYPAVGVVAGHSVTLHYGNIAAEYAALADGAMLVDRSVADACASTDRRRRSCSRGSSRTMCSRSRRDTASTRPR